MTGPQQKSKLNPAQSSVSLPHTALTKHKRGNLSWHAPTRRKLSYMYT